jgi:hypothetical protein
MAAEDFLHDPNIALRNAKPPTRPDVEVALTAVSLCMLHNAKCTIAIELPPVLTPLADRDHGLLSHAREAYAATLRLDIHLRARYARARARNAGLLGQKVPQFYRRRVVEVISKRRIPPDIS